MKLCHITLTQLMTHWCNPIADEDIGLGADGVRPGDGLCSGASARRD